MCEKGIFWNTMMVSKKWSADGEEVDYGYVAVHGVKRV